MHPNQTKKPQKHEQMIRSRSARVIALHSLRPVVFNRSSKLNVRAVRGCASPVTDALRIPSRVSSVRCSALAVDKRDVSAVGLRERHRRVPRPPEADRARYHISTVQ